MFSEYSVLFYTVLFLFLIPSRNFFESVCFSPLGYIKFFLLKQVLEEFRSFFKVCKIWVWEINFILSHFYNCVIYNKYFNNITSCVIQKNVIFFLHKMKEKSFSIFLKTFQITHFENTFLAD